MDRAKSIVSAIVVIIVQVAALYGVSLDAGTVTTVISVAAALAVLVWGIWKNHNFTDAANRAQNLLNTLKSGDANAPASAFTTDEIKQAMSTDENKD